MLSKSLRRTQGYRGRRWASLRSNLEGLITEALVAYATKNGSTREVAEAIAEVLRSRGMTATVAEAGQFREPVDSYDLIVLGGAIYSGRWHGGAQRFLRRHRRELDTPKVAVFGMGPRDDDQESWQSSRAQLDRALSKQQWLKPVAVTVFGGVDPPKKQQHRDLRDWDAIRAWANTLVGEQPTRGDEET